jgi:hypothetical protein
MSVTVRRDTMPLHSCGTVALRQKRINYQLLRHRRVCVFTAALIVFTLGTKNCVRFPSFPDPLWSDP